MFKTNQIKIIVTGLSVIFLALAGLVFVVDAGCYSGFCYNDNPTTVGPFPKTGEVRIYFQNLANNVSSGVRFELTHGSQNVFFTPTSLHEMFNTGIQVQAGDYLTVYGNDVGYGSHVGWAPPDSSNRCGSGLPMSPTGYGYYPLVSIGGYIDWANQAGEPLVSKECWADWPEWSGDYDFEDYFMIFSYVPSSAPPQVDIKANGFDGPVTVNYNSSANLTWTTANNPSACVASNGWLGNKAVSGGSESTGILTDHHTYTITCSNSIGSDSDSVLVQVLHCLSAPPALPI